MARDRRVGGIGEPELHDGRAPGLRVFVGTRPREEPVDDQLPHLIAAEFRRPGLTDQARTRPQQGDERGLGGLVCQQPLLGITALLYQLQELRGTESAAGPYQPPLGDMGQGQIHVIATQHQVLADADTFQLGVAIGVRYADQGQVGGATTDIADQEGPDAGEGPVERLGVPGKPVVASGLGLLH